MRSLALTLFVILHSGEHHFVSFVRRNRGLNQMMGNDAVSCSAKQGPSVGVGDDYAFLSYRSTFEVILSTLCKAALALPKGFPVHLWSAYQAHLLCFLLNLVFSVVLKEVGPLFTCLRPLSPSKCLP